MIIVHYPAVCIILATITFQYGFGAVLSDVCKDDSDKPISYMSRSIMKAKKLYSNRKRSVIYTVWHFKVLPKFIIPLADRPQNFYIYIYS